MKTSNLTLAAPAAVCVLLVAACASQKKIYSIVSSSLTASLSLPAVAQKAFALPDSTKELTVMGEDGARTYIMKAVRDEQTGEMVATAQLSAAVLVARFRNVAERQGSVDLEFLIVVSDSLQDPSWQLHFEPVLNVMEDTLRLEPVLITGEDFRREFSEWIARYRFTDLYTAGFYPFETEEERWAYWAKHIWFARYRTGALPLYKELLEVVREKDYFVLTTNVDAQFEMAGFAAERIFATQGDYAFFQPASGEPKELYNNREWVERVLPKIRDCRIPSEMVPHTPDGEPVAMNLRCDNTFVEDARWHEQEARYSAFVQQAADKRLLLLEFGVGFNTPVIIRMPFERMAAQLPDTTLVRFNRDYPQPYQAGIEHFIPFTEDINRIVSQLNHH